MSYLEALKGMRNAASSVREMNAVLFQQSFVDRGRAKMSSEKICRHV